jgi:GTP-binding protein
MVKINKSEFLYSVPKLSLMRDTSSEVAFIGRSNAGKSSLINALCEKELARTSKTPGRTRHAVAYEIIMGKEAVKAFTMIDLPGFGFALMSKTEAKECEALIFSYLKKRSQLRVILLLLDIRRELDEREQRIVHAAKERNVDVMLVLTKSDKIPVSKRRPTKMKIAHELNISYDAIFLHSTHDSKTSAALRKAIFMRL